MGAGTKRKGDQPSSNSGKKEKASGSQGFQSPGYPGQVRARVARRTRQMLYFHCQQLGHMTLEIGIPGFWDSSVPVSGRTGEDTVCSSTP